MPLFDFVCETVDCEKFHHVEEHLVRGYEPLKCPSCDEPMRRMVSKVAAPIFRGTGYYATDFKNNK